MPFAICGPDFSRRFGAIMTGQMYRISQLAEQLGLSRTTLLYYEKIGVVRGKRMANGYRCYDDDDLQRLRLVLLLRSAGLSLRECVLCLNEGLDREVLLDRYRELVAELEALEQRRENLEVLLGLDRDGLRDWHRDLDRVAPAAHEELLMKTGFSEGDIYHLRWLSHNYTNHEGFMNDFMTIYSGLDAHGPGTSEDTLAALGLVETTPARILEIGCGPGNATLTLAKNTSARITALDNMEGSLQRLGERVEAAGLAERISIVNASMDKMPFESSSFDLIWCETSAYIMGFEDALSYWRDFVREGGSLVVSDLVWLREDPPDDLVEFWRGEYPDMQTLSNRVDQVETAGFELRGTHILGHDAWASYYEPLEQRVVEVRDQLLDHSVADALLEEVEVLRSQVDGWFSYVFFIMKP